MSKEDGSRCRPMVDADSPIFALLDQSTYHTNRTMIPPHCFGHSSMAAAALSAPPTTVLHALPLADAGLALNPLVSALWTLSGGASTLDINRFKLRLDGMHTYAVITTLLMNASLRLFSATPKRFVPGEKTKNLLKVLFSLMVTVSILTGSYTTIVFSLLELYAKRALGRNLDTACLTFFQQTQPVRESAYDTWIVSLVSFQASFVLSLFLNHDKGFDWKIALFGAVAAILCWWKWSTIMTLAAATLAFGSDM